MANHGRFDFSSITPKNEEMITKGTITNDPLPLSPAEKEGSSGKAPLAVITSSAEPATTAADTASKKGGSLK